MISQAEENYLKAIFKITERDSKAASTNAVAAAMNTAAASVTDMLKRLAAKDLVHYEKSRGVTLTTEGSHEATKLIRGHRIWEVFLCERLGYSWDECHDLAEQLEHIQSRTLVDRMDTFLGKPKFDPHGDPIPDSKGRIKKTETQKLIELNEKKEATVNLVSDQPELLRYLSKIGIALGSKLKVLEKISFDNSMLLQIDGKTKVQISADIAKNISVQL